MRKEENGVAEEQDLPVNRKQLFFRAFRNEYPVILLISVFMTLFAIPLFAVIMLSLAQLARQSGADLSVPENVTAMYGTRFSMYLWCVPALLVFAVGASGAFFVTRNLVWNRDIKFFRDFGKGIKDNVLQFEIVTLVFALFAFGVCYGLDVLSLRVGSGAVNTILTVLRVFLLFLAAAFLTFQYCGITVYKGSVLTQFKNSIVLVFGSLPLTTAALIGALSPLLAIMLFMFFQSVIVLILLSTALAVVGFGFSVLLITLRCHTVFDKCVNKENFPEIYRRGLFDKEAAQKKFNEEHNRQY